MSNIDTVIPAQPGFFVVYPDGEMVPVIAWMIHELHDHNLEIWPITVEGWAGVGGVVKYFSNL